MRPFAMNLTTLLYVVVSVGVTAAVLQSFSRLLQDFIAIQYTYAFEVCAVVGQIGFQWLFMLNTGWPMRLQYALLALTVSFVGALLLLPSLVFALFAPVSAVRALIYFLVVVTILFFLHAYLLRKAKLPRHLTLSWIAYRVLLLISMTTPWTYRSIDG